MKELFKKLGFLNNKDKKTEVKKHTKPEVKTKDNGEKIKGFDFHHVAKENTIKGCSFVEDKV